MENACDFGSLVIDGSGFTLLDGTTNHLDLPTIQWLESYLQEYQGTYVIVSHDRYFLNRTVNRIAEVAHQQIFHYKGNFNNYLEQKRSAMNCFNVSLKINRILSQQMNFISRFRYKASKGSSSKSGEAA